MPDRMLVGFFCACGLVAAIAAFALWKLDQSSRQELEGAVNQYAQLQSQLARYEALRATRSPQVQPPAASLFSQVNQLGDDLGLSGRIEAMRPSGKGEGESLDFQIRSLYLGEFLRFLDGVEGLAGVTVERLALNRTTQRLLDLEMRISRRLPQKS